MSHPKSRGEPEVVVFEEPRFVGTKRGREAAREREKYLAGDVSEIFSTKQHEGEKDRREKSRDEGIDFKATLREVQTLSVSTLTGRERRKFEQEQIIALGGKEPKPPKMPYPHYQRMIKARREKEKRLEDELHMSSSPSSTRKKKGRSRKIKGKGRWKDSMTSLKPPVGKFKGGVLKLSTADIGKINRTT